MALTAKAPTRTAFSAASRRPARSARLAVRANSENGATSTATIAKPPPVLTWTQDNETARDVFAFAGPLPERLNGRVAMWAFAQFALTELSTHTPVLEQFAENWPSAILFSLTMTSASIFPKLASGTSLKELHEAATTQGMGGDGIRQLQALFDQNFELWTGRIAMVGIVGLIAAEVVRGDSFF